MNTRLTDSNAILARQTGTACGVRYLGVLLALFCVGLTTSIFSTACSAVDFVEIEFNADFRSPSSAGKIPVTGQKFRSPAEARNLHALVSDSSGETNEEETIENDPFELQPAGWYANDTNGEEVAEPEAGKWTHKPLTAIGTNIALPGGGEIPNGEGAGANIDHACCDCYCNRGWSDLCYCFAATGLYYNPLYFEEVNLERYGYGCKPCLQSAVSAAHFFGHVPLLPYMMATDCPSDCIYALGHYRPGNCVPWRRHCLPINKRGGLGQAGAIVGLVFLLP